MCKLNHIYFQPDTFHREYCIPIHILAPNNKVCNIHGCSIKKKIKNQDTHYAYKNAFICIPYCGVFLISNLEKIAKLQDSNCEMHLSCSEQNPVC